MTAERFGPYVLDEQIGSGGMGVVYRAFDSRRDRYVALKLLPAASLLEADCVARFRQEQQIAARLNEPHIVPIHDFGEIDGRLFLDMRLVEGRHLRRLLDDDGPVAPARAVHLVAQIAEALDAAHADGLVHRDVKPSNVIVTATDFAYVVDFGIAQVTGPGRR